MRLFKYIGLGSEYGWGNIIEILKLNRIWVSSTRVLNDPFEGRYEPTTLLKGVLKLDEVNNARVLSLSQTPSDNLMWAHYGTSHNGVVFEFDINECDFLKNAKEVNYIAKLPSADLNVEELLMYKHNSWKYEKEYRLVVKPSLSDFSYAGNHYDIHPSALKAVYLGKNISSVHARTILTMCKSRNLDCLVFSDIDADFQIKFHPVKDDEDLIMLYRLESYRERIKNGK